MARDTRLEQLCNIEAMAQIAKAHPAFRAMKIVAYAAGPVRIEADTLVARHAAVEARGGWHHLTYRCGYAPDRRTLRGFDLVIGKPIPESYWERYNLPVPGGHGLD
jgi:hypothetical protein